MDDLIELIKRNPRWAEEEIVDLRENADRLGAAAHWFSEIRQLVINDTIKVNNPAYTLAASHALSEIWLSGEKATCNDVADLLGWNYLYSAEAVRSHLLPLTKVHPPLITEDNGWVVPNIGDTL